MTDLPGVDRLEQGLQAMREKYRAGLPATLATLGQLAAQIDTTPTESAVLESLRREVHRLHGSAGTYGFDDASRLAAALEARLVAWSSDAHAEPEQRGLIVGNFIRALRTSVLTPEGAPSDGPERVVALIGVPEVVARGIVAEASLRGFNAQRVEPAAASRETLEAIAPRALIAPADSLASVPDGLGVPVVVLAERGDGKTARHMRTPDAPLFTVAMDEPPTSVLDIVQDISTRTDLGGATLLVVDDDPVMLTVIRSIAEHDGLRVVSLESADDLRETIAREAPAMLVMDIHLGTASGVDITRELRLEPSGRDLAIVLFSGQKDPATREQAFRAGADDFFAKPVVPAELRRRLHERLERRRLRRLADGVHPLIDVTLAARTTREAASMWSNKTAQTMIVVRAAPGFDDIEWLAEVRRIAAALAPHTHALGFDEDDALLAVSRDDATAVTLQVETLRSARPGNAPLWHAGVAAAADAGGVFGRARRAAMEALDVARRSGALGVHRWTLEDDAVAPDVIVVEDDAALADMLQYALRLGGYTYRAFGDGHAALDGMLAMRTGSRRPVVLLDVDLPGLDGHSLHERLRVERPGAFVVVFVSVHASEGDQVRALNAGAWDYLAKPLNLRVLLAKLPVWLARAAAEP
ncbi:MAG TPA: response regulator [Gemmatimonadaceae bacterium]|nr:response regulator [Gemmatimonadaceae bacterium]